MNNMNNNSAVSTMNRERMEDVSEYLAATLSKNGTSTADVQIRPKRWLDCTSGQVVPSSSRPSTWIVLKETVVLLKRVDIEVAAVFGQSVQD